PRPARTLSSPAALGAAGGARSPARLVLTQGTVGGGTAVSGEAGSPSQRPKAAFAAAATASGRTSTTTRRVASRRASRAAGKRVDPPPFFVARLLRIASHGLALE